MNPITNERRFFGPGLPPTGVSTAEEAYRLGLAHCRTVALLDAGFRELTPKEIVEDYEAIIRIISSATDVFIETNGTMLDAIERELRRGAELEEQPDAIDERIRERENDEDHRRQVAEACSVLADPPWMNVNAIDEAFGARVEREELVLRVRHATMVNADLGTTVDEELALEAELAARDEIGAAALAAELDEIAADEEAEERAAIDADEELGTAVRA